MLIRGRGGSRATDGGPLDHGDFVTETRRFPCTPGGAILRGRRRLRLLLVGLTVLMLAVALAAGIVGRIGPALLALGVALIPWTAWRMSGDLDPFWLETGGGWLGVQMRRRRERFAAAGAEGRRLTAANPWPPAAAWPRARAASSPTCWERSTFTPATSPTR